MDRDLTARQRQLYGYVVTYAQDYGKEPLGVLHAFQRGPSSHTAEQLADFDAVAAILVTEDLPPATGPVLPPLPEPRQPVATRPEQPYETDCTSRDAYGTCLHRFVAGYVLASELCRGCTRLFVEALDGAVPDLRWHRSWDRRAGITTGEVSR